MGLARLIDGAQRLALGLAGLALGFAGLLQVGLGGLEGTARLVAALGALGQGLLDLGQAVAVAQLGGGGLSGILAGARWGKRWSTCWTKLKFVTSDILGPACRMRRQTAARHKRLNGFGFRSYPPGSGRTQITDAFDTRSIVRSPDS